MTRRARLLAAATLLAAAAMPLQGASGPSDAEIAHIAYTAGALDAAAAKQALAKTLVVILGCALGGFIAAMSAVIIGLLVGGPVGRFKGSAGRDGVSLEAEGEQ